MDIVCLHSIQNGKVWNFRKPSSGHNYTVYLFSSKALIYLITIVSIGDITAFFVGKKYGKTLCCEILELPFGAFWKGGKFTEKTCNTLNLENVTSYEYDTTKKYTLVYMIFFIK